MNVVLASGYNRIFRTNLVNRVLQPDALGTFFNWPDSQEYVFIYDISTNTPVKKQVVTAPNTYNGIAFDPSGTAFYVSSGVGDVPFDSTGAVNNDSITVFTGSLGNWSQGTELDLRPGKSDSTQVGVPGGEYSFWVVVKGNGAAATAYVSIIRDREIVVVSLGATLKVTARIPVTGQPNKMTLNQDRSILYVADDQADTIDVIDTATNTIIERIPVLANTSVLPTTLKSYKGANPNSVTLSPDEKQLWVTLGTLNAVAVVALSGENAGDQVVGLIPTGWYPNSVSFSADGAWAYVVNGKSPTGANPDFSYDGWAWSTAAQATDVVQKQEPVMYAGRGLSLDNGTSRSVNVALPTVAERQAANPLTSDDPDALPGQVDITVPDGPENAVNTGFLWDAALRANTRTIR